jgi:hypothetical protein
MSHIPPFLSRLSPRKGLVVFHRSGSRTRSSAPVVVDESLGFCVCLCSRQHEAGSREEDALRMLSCRLDWCVSLAILSDDPTPEPGRHDAGG